MLSSDDNICYTYLMKEVDHALETLLDLDGFMAEIGQGYWVKFEIKKAAISKDRPFGIKYSLTLHGPDGTRIIGIDNAHAVPGFSSKRPYDHIHNDKIRSYKYKDAASLLEDFWRRVDSFRKERGIL